MTMPNLMNCDHSGDGWCLGCVKKLHDLLESRPEAKPEPIPYVDWSRVPAPPTDRNTVLSYKDGAFVWIDAGVCEVLKAEPALEVGDLVKESIGLPMLYADGSRVQSCHPVAVVSLEPFTLADTSGNLLKSLYRPRNVKRYNKLTPENLERLMKDIEKKKAREVHTTSGKRDEKHLTCEMAIATRVGKEFLAIRWMTSEHVLVHILGDGEFRGIYCGEINARSIGYTFSTWEQHTVGKPQVNQERKPVLEVAEVTEETYSGTLKHVAIRIPGLKTLRIVTGARRTMHCYLEDLPDNMKLGKFTPLYAE